MLFSLPPYHYRTAFRSVPPLSLPQALTGFGMEMMDVIFTQILGWNYTVTYMPFSWDRVSCGTCWGDYRVYRNNKKCHFSLV